MVRSILLRGFDMEIANKIGDYMKWLGVEFINEAIPVKFEKTEDGKVRVFYEQVVDGVKQEKTEIYGGVMLAVGRYAITQGLKLENAGVKVNSRNMKIICNQYEQSNIPNIWAVGDVSDGKPELTPVAIHAGLLLAKRLFGGSNHIMDYINIATTVFTPIEYGSCGMSEEKAIETFGDANVEVYHTAFKPLEWNFLPDREDMTCFGKIIVNLQDNERIIGMHYLGPNAGEVIQGYAAAMKAGITKSVLDMTIGIHPTCSEELTKVSVTKRSGQNAAKTGC
jgi:thioredoxin reductase (NADPH)